jgi:hypothetical protein
VNRRDFLALPVVGVVIPTGKALLAFPGERMTLPKQIDFSANVPAAGTFPKRWICGSSSCMDNQDPPVQVHWYNEHTAFLRQNKAYSYEAPFMHLYFGNERILMIDQGYTQLRSDWPLREVVDALWSGADAMGETWKRWSCFARLRICTTTTMRGSTSFTIARILVIWG